MDTVSLAQPMIVMFVGLPGSGKTTFAKQLSNELGAILLASDSIRIAMWGNREAVDKSHSSPEERRYANQLTFGALNYATEQAIASGHHVIYDCNANRLAERSEKYEIAERYSARAIIVRIKVPYDVSLSRLQERTEAHDARQFDAKRAPQVLAQFAAEIEEPGANEICIEIDGEATFSDQLSQFYRQLEMRAEKLHVMVN